MKKKLAFILLLIWLIVIFYLSNQNSIVSGGSSGNTIRFILNLFHVNNVDSIVDIIHNPLRETMHAFEYFILGILSYNFFRFYNFKKIILFCVSFCVFYSISDEVHQIFIPGRTFELLDLFLDFIGSYIGILLFNFVMVKKFKFL